MIMAGGVLKVTDRERCIVNILPQNKAKEKAESKGKTSSKAHNSSLTVSFQELFLFLVNRSNSCSANGEKGSRSDRSFIGDTRISRNRLLNFQPLHSNCFCKLNAEFILLLSQIHRRDRLGKLDTFT